jgi:hypothetical protein
MNWQNQLENLIHICKPKFKILIQTLLRLWGVKFPKYSDLSLDRVEDSVPQPIDTCPQIDISEISKKFFIHTQSTFSERSSQQVYGDTSTTRQCGFSYTTTTTTTTTSGPTPTTIAPSCKPATGKYEATPSTPPRGCDNIAYTKESLYKYHEKYRCCRCESYACVYWVTGWVWSVFSPEASDAGDNLLLPYGDFIYLPVEFRGFFLPTLAYCLAPNLVVGQPCTPGERCTSSCEFCKQVPECCANCPVVVDNYKPGSPAKFLTDEVGTYLGGLGCRFCTEIIDDPQKWSPYCRANALYCFSLEVGSTGPPREMYFTSGHCAFHNMSQIGVHSNASETERGQIQIEKCKPYNWYTNEPPNLADRCNYLYCCFSVNTHNGFWYLDNSWGALCISDAPIMPGKELRCRCPTDDGPFGHAPYLAGEGLGGMPGADILRVCLPMISVSDTEKISGVYYWYCTGKFRIVVSCCRPGFRPPPFSVFPKCLPEEFQRLTYGGACVPV